MSKEERIFRYLGTALLTILVLTLIFDIIGLQTKTELFEITGARKIGFQRISPPTSPSLIIEETATLEVVKDLDGNTFHVSVPAYVLDSYEIGKTVRLRVGRGGLSKSIYSIELP